MKKLLLAVIIAAMTIPGFSQADMPVVWQKDMGIKYIYHGTGLEKNDYSYVASEKEMAVFSNKDGHIYWKKTFKEIAPNLKKIDELVPFWDSKIIFLFDRKAGKDQIACIDLINGKLLWTTDKYQKVTADMIVYIAEDDGFAISLKKELVYIKARTGEELWSTSKFMGVVGKYVYNPNDNTMVMVNFIPNGIVAFFTGFKNQIARINMKTGEIIWENTYVGRADRKTVTRDFVYDLDVDDDKVILRLAGIQLYDYNTGASLWSAAFDYTPEGVIKPGKNQARFGVYGTVADPIVDGDDIYVLDMTSKKSQYIKKYDYHTGKLIWTSKEIKGARAIPGMTVTDGVVAIQVGGMVEVQYVQKIQTQYYTLTFPVVRYKGVKPYGIQAFNAEDGSYLWDSERFKKGITNAIVVGGNHIVCSGKSLYSLNLKTGDVNYEVPVSKGGTGLASLILPYNDQIVVVGEKGLSTFNPSDGSFIKNSVYKKSIPAGRIKNIILMKTDKDDFAAFNLDDLSYKQYNARKGATTWLEREDAKYVYVYEKKGVTKLQVY
ncbi:MAG: PQQ-binding-like beta-propeller repeat protein [Chlorobi bacterium]|nr:PQQ-binding-like beta-propeller repeat protein [Chlorobiota bacterium]